MQVAAEFIAKIGNLCDNVSTFTMKLDEKTLIKGYETNKHRLGHLRPRYLEIFEYRLGLMDGSPHSQEETGQKFGISGTRIRQIEERVKYELEQLRPNYQCPECGLKYAEKAWAEKCEAWCKVHHSCNLEITAHAEKETTP